MTLKAFKACFKTLIKLYNVLDDKFEFNIVKREMKIIFFNAFSIDRNRFFAQQNDYSKMSMDDFVTYFQILHAQEAPYCK